MVVFHSYQQKITNCEYVQVTTSFCFECSNPSRKKIGWHGNISSRENKFRFKIFLFSFCGHHPRKLHQDCHHKQQQTTTTREKNKNESSHPPTHPPFVSLTVHFQQGRPNHPPPVFCSCRPSSLGSASPCLIYHPSLKGTEDPRDVAKQNGSAAGGTRVATMPEGAGV